MTKVTPRFDMTDEEIQRLIEEEKKRPHNPVTSARYDKKNDRVVLDFQNGMTFMVPRALLQDIADIPKSSPILNQITVLGAGTAISWDDIDVGFSIEQLLEGVVGSKKWMSYLASRAAGVKTAKKAAASRENGRKGGRPRKTPQAACRARKGGPQ